MFRERATDGLDLEIPTKKIACVCGALRSGTAGGSGLRKGASAEIGFIVRRSDGKIGVATNPMFRKEPRIAVAGAGRAWFGCAGVGRRGHACGDGVRLCAAGGNAKQNCTQQQNGLLHRGSPRSGESASWMWIRMGAILHEISRREECHF